MTVATFFFFFGTENTQKQRKKNKNERRTRLWMQSEHLAQKSETESALKQQIIKMNKEGLDKNLNNLACQLAFFEGLVLCTTLSSHS